MLQDDQAVSLQGHINGAGQEGSVAFEPLKLPSESFQAPKQPFRVHARKARVLLGVSGSVAAIKIAQLAHSLAAFSDVKIVATTAARHFINEEELPASVLPLHGDEEEWHAWQKKGDPVLHIELRKWADVLIIAPLSANSLAKAAQGFCDNCLTSVVRAWDFSKPLLVAPAMNTFMWESPFTGEHLAKLQKLGVRVIAPISKALACGDIGAGAMAEPGHIAAQVYMYLYAQTSDGRSYETMSSAEKGVSFPSGP